MDLDVEDNSLAAASSSPRKPSSRATTSEPPSLPHRDPLEDADSSLTRKRPRLDSGGRARRSVSADFTPPDSTAMNGDVNNSQSQLTSQQAERIVSPKVPSRVTINVRSQPSRSSVEDLTAAQRRAESDISSTADDNAAMSEADMLNMHSTIDPDAKLTVRNDSLVNLGPELQTFLLEEEEEEEEPDDEPDIEAMLASFPLHGDDQVAFVDSAKTMTTLLHNGGLDSSWLSNLTTWLDDHVRQTALMKEYWRQIYSDEHDFWEEISNGFLKLLQRTKVIYEEDAATVEQELGRLLKAYTRLTIRLIQTDVENLRLWTGLEPSRFRVLSARGLKALQIVFSATYTTGVRPLLQRVCQNSCLSIAETFLSVDASGESGIQAVASFAKELLASMHCLPALHGHLLIVVRLTHYLADVAHRNGSDSEPENGSGSFTGLARQVLQVFEHIDEELQVFIDGRVLSLPTTEARRDVLMIPAILLQQCAELDEKLAEDLFRDIVFDPERCSKENIPELLANVWKMKLLKKCFVKSKMEMRVTAVATMSMSLVDLWSNHSSHADEVMQHLADVLLQEEIPNYIVGVDSHPNLIARSSNIIGFFIVNGKYGQGQTDLIWNTVAHSSDPRVVTATLQMIGGMMNLMAKSDQLYLCRKLAQLPVEAFNQNMLTFWAELFNHIFSPRPDKSSWTDFDERGNVFDLCTHVMHVTFPGKVSTANVGTIHYEASSLLLRATQAARFADREVLYAKLLEDIKNHSELAGANAEIIFYMIRNSLASSYDLEAVVRLELLRATIEDYAHFVRRSSSAIKDPASSSTILAELGPRLDLIILLLSKRPQAAPVDLFPTLWDVTVGSAAINDAARDRAWCKLADLASPQQGPHAFLDLCLSNFIPEMDPNLYTAHSYQFIESAVRYLMGIEGGPSEKEDGTINIPGVSLMWHVMLAVPRETIEEPIVRLLASAYQESTLSRHSKPAITKTHVAITEQCVKELSKEWADAHPGVKENGGCKDVMEVDRPSDPFQAESRFARITLFLGTLLRNIRSSTKYILPLSQPNKEPVPSSDTLIGDPLAIRYQAFNGHQGKIESLAVGSSETRRQLHNRLRDATGFASFQTILAGQKIDLLELPNQTLDDWGRAEIGSFLVKEVKTSSLTAYESVLHVGRCEAELELLNHFDNFYQFMEHDDSFSRLTYDFLATIPAYEGAKLQGLVDGSATLDEVFPAGRLYQIRYSIRCLQTRLESQIRTKSVDKGFVEGALRLLSDFATKHDNIASDRVDLLALSIVKEPVQCLLRFLVESPVQAKSLMQPGILVDRLLAILRRSAQDYFAHNIAGDVYATILELAAHSSEAWQTFASQEDLTALHCALFFEEPPSLFPKDAILPHGLSPLRQKVAVVIRNKVKTGLRWITTFPTEVAMFFWKLLEPIIPHSLQHYEKAHEFLQTADVVLETLVDEYMEDELRADDTQAMLRGCLERSVDLLAQHTHTEFVGRNEADVVVKGLARIAQHCYLALDRAAAGPAVNKLIDNLPEHLLFPPLSLEDDDSAASSLTPVLDSTTRKALYDLFLDVCRDTPTLHRLLGVALDALHTDDFSRTLYYREYFLRAPSGLVGIRNLGNTCYMNALLTQLFMNIDFRKFMLDLPITDPQAQGLVLAIQALFAQMQEGYQKYVDASDLTRLITTFEGEAIDVTQQMDVEEFFNLKFDQTEAQILAPDDKKAFRSIYGGQMINQIKSKECEHVSERLEPYFAVQCDVKGKTSLLESLQAFIQGDVMEGDNKYKCESCDGRLVNAVKRTCLKDVPNNLIFHLKRFDFDIGTMQRSKINDLFEFPMRIDVSPYTFEHLNEPDKPIKEDPFDLVGVLLHKGVAEHGHYFSYIKSRPTMSGEPPRWFCFDDADVTEFSPSEIKEKCYGGTIDAKELSFLDGTPMLKGYNAYMLFYQRAGTIENQDTLASLDLRPPKVNVPAQLFEGIRKRNEVILREYTLFDPTHLHFLKDLLNRLPSMRRRTCTKDHDLENYAIKTALMYLHQVFSRNKDTQEFQNFLELIQDMISGCHLCHLQAVRVIFPDPAELAEDHSIISDLLIRSTIGKVRHLFQEFVAGVIAFLKGNVRVTEAEYGVAKDDSEFDRSFPFYGDDSVILRVVQVMAYHMEHLGANTRSWDHFFGLLCSIAGLGLGEVAALLEHKVFTRCLDLILLPYEVSYEPSKNWRVLARILEKRSVPHNRLIELVDMILCYIDLREPECFDYEDRLSEFDEESQTFPLIKDEYYLLVKKYSDREIPFFLYRIFDAWDISRQSRDHASSIFARLQTSETIAAPYLYNVLQGGIEAGTNPQPYLAAAIRFCAQAPERLIERMVSVGVQCTLSVDATGLGLPLLNFFHNVAFKEARGCPGAPLTGFRIVISEMSNWANVMIFNSDSEVRENACKLIISLLDKDLSTSSMSAGLEQERLRSVRLVASHTSRTLQRCYDEGTAGKKQVRPAVSVMRACKEYLVSLPEDLRDANDEDLIERAGEHYARHLQWPWQDEMEQSDDWQSETNLSDEDVIELS